MPREIALSYEVNDYIRVSGYIDGTSFSRSGRLVHIFSANEVPEVSEVIKYYGNKAPKEIFRAQSRNRLVLQKDNGHYFIVPYNIERYLFRREQLW